MMLVTLELYHHVYDVFKYLGAGYCTVLCYMPYEYDRYIIFLGIFILFCIFVLGYR